MKKLLIIAAVCGFFYAKNLEATCTNPASYVDGNVLTAASLNTNFGAVATCVDEVLNGDTFTGSINLNSAADLNVYSDTATTLKASIDGASGAIIGGLTQAGQVTNCGVSVSGSTFTIAGYDGTALSATNPCVVAVRSNTAGRVALAYFTANITFTFGSTSDTDGNLFNVTSSVNWASAMPFFIGVIYNGTTPYFTISRGPIIESTASSATLCQKGDVDCDGETDVMILASGLTLSGFVSLPITQVGWFQMTYATSGSAWTAAVNSRTGFNSEYENIEWTMPLGQNGSAASNYLKDNGGTAPFLSINTYTYFLKRNGECFLKFALLNDGGGDGSGATEALISAPYKSGGTSNNYTYNGVGLLTWNAGSKQIAVFTIQIGLNSIETFINSSSTAYYQLLNSDFPNGSRSIQGSLIYKTSFVY